jgi:hypothetical protein
MKKQIKCNVEVDITPELCAEWFAEASAQEQAQFFNKLGDIVKSAQANAQHASKEDKQYMPWVNGIKDLSAQLKMVSKEPGLAAVGQLAMQAFCFRKTLDTQEYKFNINHHIKTTLTAYGKKILDEHIASINEMIHIPGGITEAFSHTSNFGCINGAIQYLEFDDKNVVRMQLWDFAEVFGRYMYNGALNVCVNNVIEFCKDDFE